MLQVITVEEALAYIKSNFSQSEETEEISIDEAVGRIVAENIYSPIDVPHFARSTMDGFAVMATDTYGCGESLPAWIDIVGDIRMGEDVRQTIHNGECMRIATGGMLPAGADAVIPVEYTDEDNGACLAYKAVSPFENVTKKGDDMAVHDCIVGKNIRLAPVHIGILASVGLKTVSVRKKITVGIISTGDEIIGLEEELVNGKIREVNSHLLGAYFKTLGCNVRQYGTAKDDYYTIINKVKTAVGECDTVVISGGSSAGTKDMTVRVLAELGTVTAHGLAMKPGKPTIIGQIAHKAVFGLPGHPQACFFVTEIVVKPLINLLSGNERETVSEILVLGENISSNHGREEFLCVRKDGESAVPIYSKSGILTSVSKAYGYIRIDRNCEGLRKGEKVRVYFFGG